ncbi:ArsR/SmtB family transcription factor [Actibacterium sp. XHP0104]|uniref:ArsR/SmtB family transcription factor n=1 Tax=Actibacterium sp. XHP0104 TaxID=2984335 RepID=UPI0021E717AB|nr:metalloregulator ArsR/SmtB family transcription factor [Actibacterium sp. XHP0104]MCV2881739.1 metalloregulator ArsR/SmtB family transcription factor [Actibacterium sp. XHP0104]
MTDLTKTFAALADSTRFAIVEKLMADGAQPAGTLAELADISAPAFSRHLKVLREAGLVSQTIRGPQRIYAVRPDAMQAIADWTISHKHFWNQGLDRLARAIAAEGTHD